MTWDGFEKNEELLKEFLKKCNIMREVRYNYDIYHNKSKLYLENCGWCDLFLDGFNKAMFLTNVNLIEIENNGDGRPTVNFYFNDGLRVQKRGEFPYMFINTVNLQTD